MDSISKSLLYSTSIPNSAPPSGALNIAPMPAAAPQSIITRLSLSLIFNREAIKEPNPLPICAIGPSRPALPPEPMVMADAIVLTRGTLLLISPLLLWNASITASVPCPSASGAKVYIINPAISPPTAGISASTHKRNELERKDKIEGSPAGKAGW